MFWGVNLHTAMGGLCRVHRHVRPLEQGLGVGAVFGRDKVMEKAIHRDFLEMLAPQMPQAKSARPEQFIDPSFLQELDREGFFIELAKRYPSK